MGASSYSNPSFEEQSLLHRLQDIQSDLEGLRARSAALQCHIGDHRIDQINGPLQRIIMVSNRLPISLKRSNGAWDITFSSGGLVAALSGLKEDVEFVWVGWIGLEVPESERQSLVDLLNIEYPFLLPVFLDAHIVSKYYNGFCNDVLWPILHYTPMPMFQAGRSMRFDDSLWEAYEFANASFSDIVCQEYTEGDVIWCHDYHLMSLPALIRQRIPEANIGWFLHTPFPSSDVYKMLPVRKQLLEAVLMSDLIGFHTYDYARHFLSCAQRLLSLETSPCSVNIKGHTAKIGVFPIGINPISFDAALSSPGVVRRLEELRARFSGKRVILGVDRMDYIKGIPHKLQAFDICLSRHPEWRDKLVMIQIAVPSRTDVAEYRQLCSNVNEMVGRINGRFGGLSGSPVQYLFQSVKFEELVALYALSDVCIVSSVRDGMNLVSHEFIACQQSNSGVLILSEFAGAAQSLAGAMRVNPWDAEELSDAIISALDMPYEERRIKQDKLYKYVVTNTASRWGTTFTKNLMEAGGEQRDTKLQVLSLETLMQQLEPSKSSGQRVIILDYENTLNKYPSTPSARTRSVLEALCENPSNNVCLLSVCTQKDMNSWFGDLRLSMFADDCAFLRMELEPLWETVNCTESQPVVSKWKHVVLSVIDEFLATTPGSRIIQQENSVLWDLSHVEFDWGQWQASKLSESLDEALLNDSRLEIVFSKTHVRVRPTGMLSKEDCIARYIQRLDNFKQDLAVGVCIGDYSANNEDMFASWIPKATQIFCARVGGNTRSKAEYYIPSVDDTLTLLEGIADLGW